MGSLFRIRPPFELELTASPEQARARIGSALAAQGAACRGTVDDEVVQITTRGEHHFWSPELRTRLEPHDNGCRLVGRFGPKPAVWIFFAVVYIHLAFISMAGGVYAMAQLTLGRSPTAAWAFPISLAVALVVRVIVELGQKLGADEMEQISEFVVEATQ